MQMAFPGMGLPTPVTKVVVAFAGTPDEMPIEITVLAEKRGRGRGRRWRNRIIEMRRLPSCGDS
jgi:hypothetical protein